MASKAAENYLTFDDLTAIGDLDAMIDYSLRILKDPVQLAHFKAQAKAVAAEFDTQRIVPMYEAIYERALEAAAV